MKGTKNGFVLFIALAIMVVASIIVTADPIGFDDVDELGSSRRGTIDAYNISAQAGNVTEMNINAISITSVWQGYYGNITGSIVLSDSSNNTLYDWSVANPTGEVYASRSNDITWSSIACANLANMSAEETELSILSTSVEGINETFGTAGLSSFYVGTNLIEDCNEVNLYNSTGGQDANIFQNVVLADTDGDLVFTSIIDKDANGFDNKTHDFQLIVAENGSNANTQTTPFYFWVELA